MQSAPPGVMFMGFLFNTTNISLNEQRIQAANGPMLVFPEFSVIDTSSKSAEVELLALHVPFYNKALLLFTV